MDPAINHGILPCHQIKLKLFPPIVEQKNDMYLPAQRVIERTSHFFIGAGVRGMTLQCKH